MLCDHRSCLHKLRQNHDVKMPSHCVTVYTQPDMVAQVSLADPRAGDCWKEASSSGWDPHLPGEQILMTSSGNYPYAKVSKKSSKRKNQAACRGGPPWCSQAAQVQTPELCLCSAGLSSPACIPSIKWAKVSYPIGLRSG